MTITIDQLVSREVHYCVSALVSTLASGYGTIEPRHTRNANNDLADAAEQAMELASPILDYEEAAIQAGWKASKASQSEVCFPDEDGATYAENWQAACELHDIEPYEREVFEHWIVSNWLAEKLAEHGEKVDTDFCGLTVWARTTTGQGIASDSVIERIYAELIAA